MDKYQSMQNMRKKEFEYKYELFKKGRKVDEKEWQYSDETVETVQGE